MNLSVERDEFHLERFLEAQEASFAVALEELSEGQKRTHWIWYVFPQMKGLGTSPMSQRFGVSGLREARHYLAHPVLGARMREAVEAVLSHPGKGAEDMLGELDASKLRSCLTLFAQADPSEQLFQTALDRLYAGRADEKTLKLLGAKREI